MLTSLVSLQKENVKKFEKLMKVLNIEGENLWKNFRNFSETFRRDLAHDNIKSQKKAGFVTLSRIQTFGKTIVGRSN